MVQTQAEKERLLKMGWFFAHRNPDGKIVTDEDEFRTFLG